MFPNLGPVELMVVMGVAVLLFGKRLPEVGRSLGKGIVEFKKGLRGIEDGLDFTSTSDAPSAFSRRGDDHASSSSPSSAHPHPTEMAVPKFEPPTSAPVPTMEYQPQPTKD
jgi:sec-independent protein translocase protein TatA